MILNIVAIVLKESVRCNTGLCEHWTHSNLFIFALCAKKRFYTMRLTILFWESRPLFPYLFSTFSWLYWLADHLQLEQLESFSFHSPDVMCHTSWFLISSVSGRDLTDSLSHPERHTCTVLSSLSGLARRQTVVIINCSPLRGLLPALSASTQLFKGSLHCRPLPATALERERERVEGGRERADSQGQDTRGGV